MKPALSLAPVLSTGLALALTGCPPDLSGEACRTDCDCPTTETCVSRVCQTGTNTCGRSPDGGGTGGDGGTGLYGTVTLNNGSSKPAGNTAWVYLWDSPPNPDGGTPPLTTLTTDAKGRFQYPQATTASYYLLAEYNIDGSGALRDPNDKYLAVGPVQVNQSPIALDVQTSSCTIFANHARTDTTTHLWEAIAAVPDVQTGLELTSGVIAVVSWAGTSQTLAYQPANSGDPLSSGQWAYLPPAIARPAAQASYEFKITAPSYDNAVCNVTQKSLTGFPTAIDIAVDGGTGGTTWDTSAGAVDTVEWTPPAGATFSVVALASPALVPYTTIEASPNATSYGFKGNTVPAADCPETGAVSCRCDVTSVLESANANGLWLDGAYTELDFQTTQ